MRIIYFFLSQLEKCFIGKKREKSLLPEEKEGPFWWTRFWQSRGDREKSFLSNAIQRKACWGNGKQYVNCLTTPFILLYTMKYALFRIPL